MAFRKAGTLLLLEQQIIEVVMSHGVEGTHGFAIAQELREGEEVRRMSGCGADAARPRS